MQPTQPFTITHKGNQYFLGAETHEVDNKGDKTNRIFIKYLNPSLLSQEEMKTRIENKEFALIEPKTKAVAVRHYSDEAVYVMKTEEGEEILAPGRVRVMTEEEEVVVRDFAAQHFANRAMSEERKAEKDKQDQAEVEETVKPMKDRTFERKIEERGKESPTKAASKRAYATLESDMKREERRAQELGQIRKVKAQRARFLEKMVDKDEKIRESKSN